MEEVLSDDFIVSALLHDIDLFKERAEKGKSSSEELKELNWKEPLLTDKQKQIIEEACYLAGESREGKEDTDRQPIPLVSIFPKITLSEGESKKEILLYYKPEEITREYPEPLQEKPDVKEYYSLLWNKFAKEFNEKIGTNPHLENLLLLLDKYTSLIPFGSTNEEISFFDHSKTTAAIASCLSLCPQNPQKKDKRFLLVGGDFSGVQNFIYTITSKGALKTLKARSFFLELFAEHIIYEILRASGLSRANIISSGGGRFSLLLPNTKEVKTNLEEIKNRINRYLIDEHTARLYFILVWSGFSKEVFCDEIKYKKFMKEKFGREINKEKQQKFKEYLSELLEAKEYKPINLSSTTIEKPAKCLRCGEEDGDGKRLIIDRNEFVGCSKCINPKLEPSECQICHKESILVELPEPAKGVFVCALCDSLYHLGEHLPEAKYIVRKDALNEQHKAWVKIEDAYYIVTNKEEVLDNDGPIWMINQWEIPEKRKNKPTYSFLLGEFRHTKEEDKKQRPYDFKDYANDSYGIKRIASLRMDVDLLGEKFKETRSLIQYTILSRQLNLFFRYYLNKILKDKDRKVAIVYSGGDDLFIVGAWNDVTEFAFDIHSAFDKFTSGEFTLSGGFVVLPHNFPLYQMARLSGDAEKRAKKNEDKEGRKRDSLTLFYTPYLEKRREKKERKKEKNETKLTFKWNEAEDEKDKTKGLKGLKEQMANLLGKMEKDHLKLKVSRGFIYNLLTITDYWRRDGKLYLPKLAWVLKRAEPGLKRAFGDEWEEKKRQWEDLKKRLMNCNTIKSLYPTLVWIELLSREEVKK